jgi:hypothetical protein
MTCVLCEKDTPCKLTKASCGHTEMMCAECVELGFANVPSSRCGECAKKAEQKEQGERPGCAGKWVAGSGGHRTHEPCDKLADWWYPNDMYSYCDEHIQEEEFYWRWQ